MPFVLISYLILAVLGAANLFWGWTVTGETPRLHLALLTTVVAVGTALLVASEHRRGHRFVATVLAGASAVGLGGVLGVYDHLLKVFLTWHGLPAPVLATVIPTAWGPPGPWMYEAEGLILIPAATVVIGALVRWGRPEERP